ncbi:NAD-dependent epimerase/dehydratase family protein [Neobacillus muris]|uniref:NAD-dependent epimerase/dehydratase family protein n=1 Tax=Neobacillus muris TaxID=2941334 RepID=UPI00203CE9F4|nr:NAD-dependent epimerase/dehydratase family protein [Neobacillus muris]
MNTEKRKVLVTGGAGFIGSHIVEELLNQKFQAAVVDQLVHGKRSNLPPGISFYPVDIRKRRLLEDIFLNEQPEIVIHLAAQTNVGESIRDPYYDSDQNIMGTINILECCKNYGVKKLIFASSAAVYGHAKQLPINEINHLNPLSFYGLSKLTAEKYIQLYSALYNLPYTILRYSNVYGERQTLHGEAGVVTIFINQVLNQEPVVINGDGEQTRDFIYVKDVAKANIAAIDRGNNQILNISTNTQTSINEVLKVISEQTKTSVMKINKSLKKGEILHSRLNNHEAINQLNWKPKHSFQEGITKTLESYRNE